VLDLGFSSRRTVPARVRLNTGREDVSHCEGDEYPNAAPESVDHRARSCLSFQRHRTQLESGACRCVCHSAVLCGGTTAKMYLLSGLNFWRSGSSSSARCIQSETSCSGLKGGESGRRARSLWLCFSPENRRSRIKMETARVIWVSRALYCREG
jgi:hypothetical protein